MKLKVIDFWAAWCGPCRMLGPIVDELIIDYKDNAQVEILKVNVDEQPEISVQYGIRTLPTILFINAETDGVVDKQLGALPRTKLEELITKYTSLK